MNTLDKKIKKQTKLFSDIINHLQIKTHEELYIIYKYYKDLKNLEKNDRYLQDILTNYTINYKKSNLLIIEILKIIRKIIDNKNIEESIEDFNNYPEYNNTNFINKINNKLEFNSLIVDNLDSTKCNIDTSENYFELAPYQIFLKNYFSKESPYKSLLIYHGTGVGKTCSGISIAENFTDTNDKIIILAGPNIINNWKNTILDTNKNSNQCTSNKYIDLFNNDKKNTNKSISRIKKKILDNNYEFYGYGVFSNKINNYIKEYITPDMKDNIELYEQKAIREYFNNKLLIIDEIHNIRTEKEKISREILNTLYKIVKYSDNMRLLILSATPMYNSSAEIVWLLNLLLLNDNRPEITDNEIFKDNILTTKGKEILNNKCRGYISFIRGNNPKTFPYRLYPTINKITKNNILLNFPSIDPFNIKIKKSDQMEYLKKKLYGCNLSNHQKTIYEKYIEENPNNKKIYDDQLRQISIFTYPLLTNNLRDTFGINGLKRCFDEKGGIYSYKKNILKDEKIGYFLKLDKLKNYSCKFHLLLNTIKHTKGIIFIYSRYISTSIIPLILALEENGYGKYNNKDILNKKDRKIDKISYDGYTENECKKLKIPFKQAKYIVLSGEDSISKNNNEELQKLNDPSNKYGKNIKIIIGSEVAKEGIDMKRIREIHIIEPWFHLNRIEQIIGRGIRYCSHQDLEKNEKNVTIFMYCAYNSFKIESSDIYTYRRAEYKSRDIQSIENILQKNAIDCSIFKNLNEIDESKLVDEVIQTSQIVNKNKDGFYNYQIIENYNPYKKIYFNLLCNEQCNNRCNKSKNIDKKYDIDTLNKKHIDNIFKIVYKYVGALYKKQLIYDIDTILDNIKLYLNIDKHILYLCLDKIINERIMLQNENNNNGYLIYKNKKYIFQPDNLEENISFYYRDKSKEDINKYITFKSKDKQEKPEKKTLKKDKKEIKIEYSIKRIKNKIKRELKLLENIFIDISWLSDDIKYQYVLDRLPILYKIHLLYFIIKNEDFSDLYDIKNYFIPNFIYKKNKYILDNDQYFKSPIGFYLNNNNNIKYYLISGDKTIKEALLSDINEIENSIDTDIYVEYLNDILDSDAYGYAFYDKNQNIEIKIKNRNRIRGKDKLGCRICNSNDFKLQDIKDYIRNITINQVIDEMEYNKLNRKNLCIYIELLLRYKTINEDNIYYINVDNILLSDIIINKL